METSFSGRVWRFGDKVNTDVLYPGASRRLPDDERPFLCMEAIRPGWSRQVQPGDIIVGGLNFGCGSSRPAPENLKALKVACVLADSVARIFFRNSVSLAFPVMVAPGISAICEDGDRLLVNFLTGAVINDTSGATLTAEAMPEDSPPMEIMRAGGIVPFLREWQKTHA